MAERSNISKSMLLASEEIYDYNCSPCLDEGRYNEALKYCVSCERYYCKKCLEEHNKFPALKTHGIENVTSAKKHTPPPVDTKEAAAPLTETCERHADEIIKMYCRKHEVVCCTVCVALNHRECEGVDYIPKIAKGIRASKKFKSYVDNMEELKKTYEQTKEEIQEEIRKITYIKDDIMKDIERFRKKIIAKLDELERKSLVQVNKRYKQLSERMNVTVSKVEKFLEQIRNNLQELDNKSEAAVFVCMKAESQNGRIKDEIERDINEFEGFSFSLDNRIQTVFDESDGLVKVDIPCKLEVKSKRKVAFKGNEPCAITDICILNDGTIVMTDARNHTLKRFSKHFNKIGKIGYNGRPFGVCKSHSYNEFVVTLFDDQKGQFIRYTDRTMEIKTIFKIGAPCRGVCLADERFFISCGGGTCSVPGHIRSFDLSGMLLCTIATDDTGNRLFAHPRFLTTNFDGTKIYVADGVYGVIVLDKTGKKIGQYKHVNMKNAYSVSCTKHGNFVSCLGCGSIQQFDCNYRFLGTVLNKKDGFEKPEGLCFIESNDQMILGSENSHEVLLLQIK